CPRPPPARTRSRRRGAALCRGPAQLPAPVGTTRAAAAAELDPRRRGRRGGRRDHNRLRPADREAGQPRRDARRSARPPARCACGDRRTRRDDEPAVPALARRPPGAPRRRDDDRVPRRPPAALPAVAAPAAAVAHAVPAQPAPARRGAAAGRRAGVGRDAHADGGRPFDGDGADAGNGRARARRSGRAGDGAAAARRPRGDEDGDAASRSVPGARTCRPRAGGRARRRRHPPRRARRRRLGEDFLQLQRGAGVAADLQLPGHVRRDRVLLPRGDATERLAADRDRHVGLRGALGDADGSVPHLDEPLPLALDVEEVRVVDAVDPRRVRPRLQPLEERARAGHDSLTGCRRSSDSRRDDGRRRPSTIATSGTSAVAQSAARRSTESASAPSATAPIPPRPIENPIERPDAVPIRLGRYSWLITIVTPNVPTTLTPKSARQIAPATPPKTMKPTTSGGAAIMLAISTGRRPRRSAAGPATTVPIPPTSSISASRWLPYAFEWPRDTSQRGMNVIRPIHENERTVMMPSSRASPRGESPSRVAAVRSSPFGANDAR